VVAGFVDENQVGCGNWDSVRISVPLPRLDWTMIDEVPYRNGIYIMFQKGETYHDMDRIVRVGTHRGQDRLRKRLKDHFLREDADSSIFRKNIGRTLLTMRLDPYLQIWEIDMHCPEKAKKYGHLIDERLETELEAKASGRLPIVCSLPDGGRWASRFRLSGKG